MTGKKLSRVRIALIVKKLHDRGIKLSPIRIALLRKKLLAME
jgi:hypothetical protein